VPDGNQSHGVEAAGLSMLTAAALEKCCEVSRFARDRLFVAVRAYSCAWC